MEQRQFEQAVQHMIHNEGVDRLTPDRVAYKLGIDARNAERMLDRMVTEGALELDSDDQGNLFYFMPGVSAGGVFTPGSEFGPPPKPLDEGADNGSHQSPSYGGPPPNTGAGPYGGGTGAAPYGAPTYGANTYGSSPSYGSAPPYSAPGRYQGQPPHQGPPPHQGQPPSYAQGGQPGYPPPNYGPAGPGSYGNPYAPPSQPNYGSSPYGQNGGSPYGPGPGPGANYRAPGPNAYGPAPQPNYQYGPPGVGAAYAYGSQALVPSGYHPGGAMEPKSPAIASILSAIFPGAGQLYNGQIGKGLVFFFVTFTLIMFSAPFGVLTYLWNILDAFGTSKRINAYGVLPP